MTETAGHFATRWPDDFALQHGRPRWSFATDRSNRYALIGFIERWGDVALDGLVDDPAFVPWINSQPPSNVKVIRAMLNDAGHPMKRGGHAPNKGRALIEAITEDELDLLGRCARDVWGWDYGPIARGLVIWQGTVGTRPIALRHLLFSHLATGAEEVYIEHPGKGCPPRTVIVPPAARMALKIRSTRGYLFTSLTGKRLTNDSIAYLWHPIRERFEELLPPDRARALRDARPDRGPMDWYEMRHAAATSLRRRGATWEQIAWQLGQTDKGQQARERYSHLTEEDHLGSLHGLYQKEPA